MKSHLYFSMRRHNETQEAWLERTAPAFRHERRETYSGDSLTEKQAAKLANAAAKLPEGWAYAVSDDNAQIVLRNDRREDVACATRHNGRLSGWTGVDLIYINRACAAVFGKQMQ